MFVKICNPSIQSHRAGKKNLPVFFVSERFVLKLFQGFGVAEWEKLKRLISENLAIAWL